MLNKIRHFFEQYLGPEVGQGQSPQRQVELATAALLVEMSRQDDVVAEEERSAIAMALEQRFELSPEESRTLMGLAREEAQDATDYFRFTSIINDRFTLEQKVEVVEALWRVAFADGVLDKYEEHMVRKIADLLYVPHSAFIAAKHRAGGA